ncbi:MAG: discoidin domain-containing protein [Bacteroidales bacterium]|nr:discoidin domain-containing protein [Bacteroidales bacterium]
MIMWDVSSTSTTEVHDGMYVVLQQGTYSDWSRKEYLNPSGSYLAEADATCIYQLKQVDTVDGYAIYVIKNVSNQQYLKNGGQTADEGDAFQCSIEVSEVDSSNPRKRIYGQDRQPDSEGRTMVFCSKEPDNAERTSWTYLGYFGWPSYMPYTDTNDWFVYEATSREPTSLEKFEMAFNDFFKNGFDAEAFPVGTNPGCISQELYDQISSVYDDAMAASDNENLSDAELDDLTARIKAAKQAYEEAVSVKAGKYYAFVCLRSNDMVYEDDANNLKATRGMAALPAQITLNEAKYIFKTEDAGDGYFYIQNLATGNYMGANPGQSAQWKTIATATNKFTIPHYSGTIFNQRHSSGDYTHIDDRYKMVQWSSLDRPGCQYYVLPVDEAQVEPLLAAIEKQQFVNKYQSYYASAQGVPGKYRDASGLTFDGNYAAAGLVSEATTNAQEEFEGPIANLFDGNYTTFFHSAWSKADIDNDWDWIEVDLGKKVSNIAVKFSMRQDNQRNAPTRAALVAPAADDDPAGAWTDTLWIDDVIYEYSTPYPNGALNNTTAIIQVKDLKAPVQKLRFAVINTANNSSEGDGPYFALSEFRVYINPRYNLIPEAVRQELDNQLAATAAMLADVDNTSLEALQAGYAALEAAVEAFEETYPVEDLTLAIDEAGYATYYSDKAFIVPEGIEATTVTAANNDGTLTKGWEYQAGDIVPAGTGILLRGEPNSYATYQYANLPAAAPEANLLRGSVEAAMTEGGDKYYKLTYATVNDERILGFFWGAEDGAAFTNAAGKAYLALPAEMAAKGYRLDGSEVTGIGQIATDVQGEGQVYSISGVRMDGSKRLPAGIYLINGRKVIVK